MELYHYGIKDMHWGVRRYQNYDGTWTEEGLERRRTGYSRKKEYNKAYNYLTPHEKEIFSKYRATSMDDQVKDKEKLAYIQKQKTIPKGSDLYRVSYTKNEPIGKERKYVSFDEDVHKLYMDPEALPWMKNAVDLDSLEDELGYSIRYKAVKDIKIADDDVVHEYIANKLENEGMKYLAYRDVIKEIGSGSGMTNVDDIPLSDTMNILKKKAEIDSFIRVNARDVLFKEKYGQNTEAIDYFIKKGYDAIADVEDGGIKSSSLIILNPEDTLKTFENKKIKQKGWDYYT